MAPNYDIERPNQISNGWAALSDVPAEIFYFALALIARHARWMPPEKLNLEPVVEREKDVQSIDVHR